MRPGDVPAQAGNGGLRTQIDSQSLPCLGVIRMAVKRPTPGSMQKRWYGCHEGNGRSMQRYAQNTDITGFWIWAPLAIKPTVPAWGAKRLWPLGPRRQQQLFWFRHSAVNLPEFGRIVN